MGYTTDFEGSFTITPPLSDETMAAINAFADERHGGNISPHRGMPALYCQWVCPDNETLCWDGNEKFYEYIPWLRIIITKFIHNHGHKLNGAVQWIGEDQFNDQGTITVKDNQVEAKAKST